MTLSNDDTADRYCDLKQSVEDSSVVDSSESSDKAIDSDLKIDTDEYDDNHTHSNLENTEPAESKVTITALSDDVVVASVEDTIIDSAAVENAAPEDDGFVKGIDKEHSTAHDDDNTVVVSNDDVLDSKLEEAIAVTIDSDSGIDVSLDLDEITELANLVYDDSEQDDEPSDEQSKKPESFEDNDVAGETAREAQALDGKKEVEDGEEEEKVSEEKEAKLESYKQFVAEQFSQQKIDYPKVRVTIEANALPSRMYFVMNILSAIIASYGLVTNSAAVVIGAMLVAMMLGPITGVALAIIDHRMPLLRKSLFTVLAGISLVVLVGFLIGLLHNEQPLTAEILSRTQPTSMDLMIALAGGTAGAYAMVSPHLSVAVVGVAVATALVPPLAASGILFANGELQLGFGALLLAITNIIAIQFTNALVLWVLGFRRLVNGDYKSSTYLTFLRRNAITLLLLAGLGTYLSINLQTNAKEQVFESSVKQTINDHFLDQGNVLTNIQFTKVNDNQVVRAVVRGETTPNSNDVNQIEAIVTKDIAENYPGYLPLKLQLRYIPVQVIESNSIIRGKLDETDAAILTN